MRTLRLITALILLVGTSLASVQVVPTTTLAKEVANNTSASSSFPTQWGNVAAGNISKEDIHSLLYPGFNGKVYAHLMPWFGTTAHMNIGYASTDPAQVHKQIVDMESRGYDGVIVVWAGYGTTTSAKALPVIKSEVDLHSTFQIAVEIEESAFKYGGCTGCTPTDALIAYINWLNDKGYFSDPRYVHINGRPALLEFGWEHYTIDYNRLVKSIRGNPIFIYRNANGLTRPYSGGAFSWGASDGNSYLDWFYQNTIGQTKPTFGDAFKGFNDNGAVWTQHRILPQNCGKQWMDSFSIVNAWYQNSSHTLYGFHVATWNDYEEGTEVESGIDNCMSMSASVSGAVLNFAPNMLHSTASEFTVDHYTVFVSTDGVNLMPLIDLAPGTRSLNLGAYAFDPGTYYFYVKQVGKPHFTNHMSPMVTYTVTAVTRTVTMTPADGAIVPTTFTVNATANGPLGVSHMRLYVDYVDVADNDNSFILSKALTLGTGSHRLVVNAWDTQGNVWRTVSIVTVQ